MFHHQQLQKAFIDTDVDHAELAAMWRGEGDGSGGASGKINSQIWWFSSTLFQISSK
jgi:hypothetical protein